MLRGVPPTGQREVQQMLLLRELLCFRDTKSIIACSVVSHPQWQTYGSANGARNKRENQFTSTVHRRTTTVTERMNVIAIQRRCSGGVSDDYMGERRV